MNKNEKGLVIFSYASLIAQATLLIIFAIIFMVTFNSFENIDVFPIILFSVISILVSLVSICVLASKIWLIVKLVQNKEMSNNDKILWCILTYFFGEYITPFVINKFILKVNDYKKPIIMACYTGVSFLTFIICFIAIYIKIFALINF